jgi:hypothetical protein
MMKHFRPGLLYVMLSRVTTSQQLHLTKQHKDVACGEMKPHNSYVMSADTLGSGYHNMCMKLI